jgi:hypothetical protein
MENDVVLIAQLRVGHVLDTLTYYFSVIAAQTLRVCREGNPVSTLR